MTKKFVPNNELFIYSLFDSKLMSHVSAILSPNDEYAKRLFASTLSDAQIFSPSDFIIYRVGSFNSETAVIEPEIKSLCSLSELFKHRDATSAYEPDQINSVDLYDLGDKIDQDWRDVYDPLDNPKFIKGDNS